MAQTQVLVAEGDPHVRTGLCCLLRRAGDVAVAGAAGRAEEALRLTRELRPDVLVLDADLPGPPAAEIVAQVRRESPGTRILILVTTPDAPLAEELATAGATGVALKDDADDALCAALRATARGEAWRSPRLEAPREVRLTPRQEEVLRLAAEGLKNRAIGVRLGLSEWTVNCHLRNVYRKLGVGGRTGAVAWAIRRRLV